MRGANIIPKSIAWMTIMLGFTVHHASANPAFDNLADNTWIKVNVSSTKRYIPRNYMSSDVLEDQKYPAGRSYSGITYGDGKLFYFGGGHASYPGNDVEIYDIESNTWTQQYMPEVCPSTDESCKAIYGGAGVSKLSPSGRPYVEHTYQQFAFDPASRKFFGAITSGTVLFDPSNKSWEIIAGPNAKATLSPCGSVGMAGLLNYDPDVNGLQMVVTSGSGNCPPTGRGIYLFQNGIWTKRESKLPSTEWSYIYSSYIPDQKIHIIKVWNKWWKYSSSNDTWKEITGVPVLANLIDSFDYDTLNKVLIGVEHDADGFRVWSYNPSTDIWAEIQGAGIAPKQTVGVAAAGPLLRYDPKNNVFMFLKASEGGGGTGGTDTEVWAYRFRQNTDRIPPSIPSWR